MSTPIENNTEGLLEILQTVNDLPEAGSGGADDIPPAATAEFGKTKASEIAPAGKSWFNDVLLPDIPADVLAQNPYAWIRKNNTTGYYDLVLSALQPWYDSAPGIRYGTSTGIVTYYQIAISTAETATEWVFNSTKDTWFGLDDNRTVLWSNHNIPNGSATATDIYFDGTEPIKEKVTGYGDFVSGSESYAVAMRALNEVAHRMQKRYSTYDLFTGEEILDFINRCEFYEKGKAESTWDLLVLSSESNAVGSVTE